MSIAQEIRRMSRSSFSKAELIDPSKDQLLRLSQAAKLFPKVNGKSKPLATIYRHATKGCRGIRLETFCDGGALFTTKHAVERFQYQLDEARNHSLDGQTAKDSCKHSESMRSKAIVKATQDVDALLAPKQKGKQS